MMRDVCLDLGRRFERLLFFTGPLSFVCVVLLLTAVASLMQEERVQGKCYLEAASVIEGAKPELNKIWKEVDPSQGEADMGLLAYRIRLVPLQLEGDIDCFDPVNEKLSDQLTAQSPDRIINTLRKDGAILLAKPLSFLGIELPEDAKITLLGSDIKITLTTLDQLLKIVMAPVLILWLGSLFNTRFRETYLIAKTENIFEIFPHLLNVYPVFTMVAPRKRSWLAYYFPEFAKFWCACIRGIFATIFVAPPIAAYAASLFFAPVQGAQVVSYIVAVIVSVQATGLILQELMPWHYHRIFPGFILDSFKK